MLAGLLPGLRQVRTPLAVGYLWLLNLWLLLADYLPRKAAGGVVGQIFELGGLPGKGVVLAALTFIAYLIGSSLNVLSPTLVLMRILSLRVRGAIIFPGTLPVSFTRAYSDLRRRQSIPDPISNRDVREIVKEVFSERHDLITKLLIADKELYSEYDRLESEADFRRNIAIPLAVLFVIMAMRLNPLWWFGLVSVIMVFWQGTTRQFEALAVLLRAILLGKIRASEPVEITK
jgi:hypothetical protein